MPLEDITTKVRTEEKLHTLQEKMRELLKDESLDYQGLSGKFVNQVMIQFFHSSLRDSTMQQYRDFFPVLIEEFFEICEEKGYNHNHSLPGSNNLPQMFLMRGDIGGMMSLVSEYGFDVNFKGDKGNTILHILARNFERSNVPQAIEKLCLEHNASLDITNDDGKKPLEGVPEENRESSLELECHVKALLSPIPDFDLSASKNSENMRYNFFAEEEPELNSIMSPENFDILLRGEPLSASQ